MRRKVLLTLSSSSEKEYIFIQNLIKKILDKNSVEHKFDFSDKIGNFGGFVTNNSVVYNTIKSNMNKIKVVKSGDV